MSTVEKKTSQFTIYNMRLAGYLMQRGIPLIDIAINDDGRNVFLFNNTPALHDAMDRWMILRVEQQNKNSEVTYNAKRR